MEDRAAGIANSETSPAQPRTVRNLVTENRKQTKERWTSSAMLDYTRFSALHPRRPGPSQK